MQMNELLPCPFCGGEASTYSMETWWVSHACDCLGKYVGTKEYATEAEAIAAWNSRAECTCEFISSKGSDYPPVCSECGYELSIYDCEWFEDGTYGYGGNYCPNCGRKVVSE